MTKMKTLNSWAVGMGFLGLAMVVQTVSPAQAMTVGAMGVSNTKLAWYDGYQQVSAEFGWPVGGRGGCTVRRIATEIGQPGSCTTQFLNRSISHGEPDVILWQLGNSVATSPVPDQDVRIAFIAVLDWFDENFPDSRLLLTSLPDYDDSAPCRGGQEYWYDFEVSNSLIQWAVSHGRAERADIEWDMYFLEDVRQGDPNCLEKYGKCDPCHQNEWRIEEDGWTLDAFLSVLALEIGTTSP